MHSPVAAYLRVYEPLAAFSTERARLWREYVAGESAMSTMVGPGIQRDQLYQSMGPGWDELPDA
ncbi:MAG: hypothetical protein ACRD0P_21260, partial [Stackebrandtia sp.]